MSIAKRSRTIRFILERSTCPNGYIILIANAGNFSHLCPVSDSQHPRRTMNLRLSFQASTHQITTQTWTQNCHPSYYQLSKVPSLVDIVSNVLRKNISGMSLIKPELEQHLNMDSDKRTFQRIKVSEKLILKKRWQIFRIRMDFRNLNLDGLIDTGVSTRVVSKADLYKINPLAHKKASKGLPPFFQTMIVNGRLDQPFCTVYFSF